MLLQILNLRLLMLDSLNPILKKTNFPAITTQTKALTNDIVKEDVTVVMTVQKIGHTLNYTVSTIVAPSEMISRLLAMNLIWVSSRLGMK